MKLLEGVKKYWWVIPALVAIPILFILGRYVNTIRRSRKMFEEYLKP